MGTLCLLLHICVVQWLLLNLLARKSVFLLEPNKPRPHGHIVTLLRGRNDSSISYAMNRLVLLVRDLDFDHYARAAASYGRLHTTAISCKFLTFPPDFLITPARTSPSTSCSDFSISTVSAVRVIYGLHVVKIPDFYMMGEGKVRDLNIFNLFTLLFTNSFPILRRCLICLLSNLRLVSDSLTVWSLDLLDDFLWQMRR